LEEPITHAIHKKCNLFAEVLAAACLAAILIALLPEPYGDKMLTIINHPCVFGVLGFFAFGAAAAPLLLAGLLFRP